MTALAVSDQFDALLGSRRGRPRRRITQRELEGLTEVTRLYGSERGRQTITATRGWNDPLWTVTVDGPAGTSFTVHGRYQTKDQALRAAHALVARMVGLGWSLTPPA